MADDTASPLSGTEVKSGRRHKRRLIVAAVLGVLALLLVAFVMPSILSRRRERASARHFEALGGRCSWRTDPPRWPFAQLAPLLGVRFAKGRERLEYIFLDRTKVADTDLAYLKGLTGLRWLYLGNTQVTDAGLVHLKGLTGLRYLDLTKTQVTDAGAAELKAALPKLGVRR